jgi:TonB family protein
MPDWKPAKQSDEKSILCHVSLPISFDLSAFRGKNKGNDSCLDAIRKNGDIIYNASSIDTPPIFPGGEAGLLMYLAKNTAFPESEIERGNEGIVVVRFIVSPTGKVSCTEVIESLGKAFDDATIKSIESMPAWTPGMHNGEAVYTYYSTHARFKLTNSGSARPSSGPNNFRYSAPLRLRPR